jgi:hypothetical protein
VRSRIVESRIVGSEHCYKSLSFCSPFSAYGNGEITLDGKENRKKLFFLSLNLRSHSKREGRRRDESIHDIYSGSIHDISGMLESTAIVPPLRCFPWYLSGRLVHIREPSKGTDLFLFIRRCSAAASHILSNLSHRVLTAEACHGARDCSLGKRCCSAAAPRKLTATATNTVLVCSRCRTNCVDSNGALTA